MLLNSKHGAGKNHGKSFLELKASSVGQCLLLPFIMNLNFNLKTVKSIGAKLFCETLIYGISQIFYRLSYIFITENFQ